MFAVQRGPVRRSDPLDSAGADVLYSAEAVAADNVRPRDLITDAREGETKAVRIAFWFGAGRAPAGDPTA